MKKCPECNNRMHGKTNICEICGFEVIPVKTKKRKNSKFCIVISISNIMLYYETNNIPHKMFDNIKININKEWFVYLDEMNVGKLNVDYLLKDRLIEIGFITKKPKHFKKDIKIGQSGILLDDGIDYLPPIDYKWSLKPEFEFNSRDVWVDSRNYYHEIGCKHAHNPITEKWHIAKQKYIKCNYCQR